MRRNLIVLLKDKLMSIDGIIPVLMELRNLDPRVSISLVIPSKKGLDIVKKNVHICECLDGIGAELICSERDGKLSRMAWLMRIFMKVCLSKTLILKFGDTFPRHSFFVRILRFFSKLREVRCFVLICSEKVNDNIEIQYSLAAKRRGESRKGRKYLTSSDRILSTLSSAKIFEYYAETVSPEKLLCVGYLRKLPCWTGYMQRTTISYPPANRMKFFLFVLTGMDKPLDEFKEPPISEVLEETLGILRRFNTRIHTVFRPHATTDMEKFDAIIKLTGYANFSIDHGHPMILSSKAVFVIGNTYSLTMLDAFYVGCPVVEYSFYDSEYLQLLGNRSIGGDCCDFFIHKDPDRLTETVGGLLSGKIRVSRDSEVMRKNYPDTPLETFRKLAEMMA
jgi:hypothetical protein